MYDKFEKFGLDGYPPEIRGRFNSFITTQFDDSLSVEMQIRSIIKWAKDNFDETATQANSLIDFINDLIEYMNEFIDTFDEKYQETILDKMQEWYDNGELESLINESLDTKYHEMDNRLTTQLVQTTTQVVDNKNEFDTKTAQLQSADLTKVDDVRFDEVSNLLNFYANGQLVKTVNIAQASSEQAIQTYIDTLVNGGSISGVTLGTGDVATDNIGDEQVTRVKMVNNFADNGRIFNGDNLDTLTKEGIYFKERGATPANLPTELGDQNIFLEVRVYKKSSTVNHYLQRITPVNDLKIEYIRAFTDDTAPTPFIKNNPIKRTILTEEDVSKVLTNGQYLGLSTTEHSSVPTDLVGKSFLLKVETFGSDERFIIQTVFQTAGEIQNTHKRLIQVRPDDNTVYDWKKDNSMLPSSGGGGEAYDQSLNTTDNVEFGSVSAETIEVKGEIPVGTLNSPPSDVRSGDMWADTTDSETHPIVRVML